MRATVGNQIIIHSAHVDEPNHGLARSSTCEAGTGSRPSWCAARTPATRPSCTPDPTPRSITCTTRSVRHNEWRRSRAGPV
jgi:hypothetical protein